MSAEEVRIMTSEEALLWQERFEKVLENARSRFKPLIVLWGPGRKDERGFQKRNKIRERIQRECPKASIVFPEDINLQQITNEYVCSIDMQEILQGLAADIIFALDISQGVGEEVARYSRIHKISSKLIIIAPNSRKEGFPNIVRSNQHIKYYSEEELQNCDRASNYCKDQVRAWLIEEIIRENA